MELLHKVNLTTRFESFTFYTIRVLIKGDCVKCVGGRDMFAYYGDGPGEL